MRNTKLILLLQRLTPKDWKAFSKFLKSPYFNSNKKLIELHTVLSKYHPSFSAKSFNKKNIYNKLFPKAKRVDEKQLANLMSQMKKCCEAFFIQERLKEKPRMEKQLLGEYFGERNWYDLFERNTEKLLKEIGEKRFKSAEDYFMTFTVNLSFYHRPETLKFKESPPNLKNAIKALTEFFVLENLKLGCELKTRAYFLSDENEMPLLEEVIQESNSLDFVEVEVYRLFIDLLGNFSEGKYQNTSTIFFQKLTDLRLQDQLNLFTILLNVANRIAIDGDHSFYKKVFELQKRGLENGFFVTNNHMHTNHFSNIVMVGILLGHTNWVRSFVEENKKSLKAIDQKVIVKYCLSRVEFEEEDYDKAFRYLSEIEEVQHKFSFGIRNLFIRVLYEKFILDDNYYDLLISKIKSFEKFIKRDTIWSKQRKMAHLKFCTFVVRFINIVGSTNTNPQDIQQINDELHKQPVIAKDWLIKKWDEKFKQ